MHFICKSGYFNITNGHSNFLFIILGEAGGWKTHFDDDMKIEAEEFLTRKLHGLDLKYPSFNIEDFSNTQL